MIIVTNSQASKLYIEHILLEVFTKEFLESNKHSTLEVRVSKDNTYVKVVTSFKFNTSECLEEISNHPSLKIAETCAIGKTIIEIGLRFGFECPPYGVLTGVRPIKIARSVFSEDIKSLRDSLLNKYLINSEKSELLYHCSCFDSIVTPSFSLGDVCIYISIPFCPSRCNYCSFVSYGIEKKHDLIKPYLDILKQEMSEVKKVIGEHNLNIRAIYVGGGTPGILNVYETEMLLENISDCFLNEKVDEFTYEIGRPDTVYKDKLLLLKNYFVNRVCINTQSTNDAVLKSIGRKHTSEDYFRAVNTAMTVGFESINTDLIAGLADEPFESFKRSVTDVISTGIDNITIHALSIKKSSEIKRVDATDEKCIDSFIDFSKKHCISNGFLPYYLYRQKYALGNHESVGYCKNGKYSLYNIAMMNECSDVIGIGAGATSRICSSKENTKHKHFENYKYPEEYIKDNTKMFSHIQGIANAVKLKHIGENH